MMLPPELSQAIEEKAAAFSPPELARAARELSETYRAAGRRADTAMPTQAHRVAYLVTRLPATYAAAVSALEAARERLPGFEPRSILDLGAGPGTAAYAACEVFAPIERATLVEADARMIVNGKDLLEASRIDPLAQASWKRADLGGEGDWEPHDLVVMSYALGEMPPAARGAVLEAAWRASAGALAIIEPGTPAGFAVIRAARAALIEQGGRVAAPCPHDGECPMTGEEPWCHFARRLSRSRRHRLAKEAEVGWEDEKYSYCVATRLDAPRGAARVLAEPVVAKGWVKLKVCAEGGLKEIEVLRRSGEDYRRAKKMKWGEAWEAGGGGGEEAKE